VNARDRAPALTDLPVGGAGVDDYRQALRLVRRYVFDPRRQAECLRTVRLLALARALALGDEPCAALALAEAAPLCDAEVGEVADAVRQALCFSGRGTAVDAAWRLRVAAILSGGLPRAAVRRLLWRALRDEAAWTGVVRRAAQGAPAGRALVIFGLGANGRCAAGAAAALGVAALAADDRPEADSCGLERIVPANLGAMHRVLVTPDDAASIVHRLRAAGVGDVLLPEDLFA